MTAEGNGVAASIRVRTGQSGTFPANLAEAIFIDQTSMANINPILIVITVIEVILVVNVIIVIILIIVMMLIIVIIVSKVIL